MYEITLKCGTRLSLSDLEAAGLSYVPCGEVDGKDQPILAFGHLWNQRKQVLLKTYGKIANAWRLSDMTGVQIMTGNPTYRADTSSPTGYSHLTDIDIGSKLLREHPDIVSRIIEVYRQSCDRTPCIIKTKSDGRRLSAFTALLDSKREFKNESDDMLLEIFSERALSRLDNRYAMIEGSVLDIPTIPKSAMQEIHGIISEVATEKKHDSKPREVVETSQIGNFDIEWDDNGRSQYFTTEHCQKTTHSSNRDEVRFTKYPDGSVDGKCFNCGETWWEIAPKKGVNPNHTLSEPRIEDIRGIEPVRTLPPDHPILNSAPPIEVNEKPSYRHFSPEERVKSLGMCARG